MQLKIKEEGFKELDAMLARLPKNVENRVLQRGVNKSMRAGVLKSLKQAAPRHKGKRSPASQEYKTLKQNLKVKRYRKTARGQKGARIDTGNAFWGAIIESGSRYIPAAPWFLPTFLQAQSAILKILRVEIRNGIELEAKKLLKGGK